MADGTSVGAEQDLAKLVDLLDEVGTRIDALDAPEARGATGSSPGAEENRAIGQARARLARQDARRLRRDLDEIRRHAAAIAARTREIHDGPRAGQASPGTALDERVRDEVRQPVATRVVARALIGLHDRDEIVRRVVADVLLLVGASSMSGVFLADGAGREPVQAASHPLAGELTALQRLTGSGPVPTVLSGAPDLARDLGSKAERVPQLWTDDRPSVGSRRTPFETVAVERGIRAVLAVSIPEPRNIGVLVLYSDQSRAFDTAALQEVGTYADHVAIALGGARRVANLNRALNSRDVIGQAKGLLGSQLKVDPEAAFKTLVSASQHSQLKLVDVARFVVNEHNRKTGVDGQDR